MTTHEQEFHEDEATPEQTNAPAESEVLASTSESTTARSARASNKERTRQSPRRVTDERKLAPVPLNDQTSERVADDADEDSTVHDLEAQGFTEDEAIRLIHVSDRMKTSREARDAEALLRRLRFTRWLIQQGMLDEFSA